MSYLNDIHIGESMLQLVWAAAITELPPTITSINIGEDLYQRWKFLLDPVQFCN